MSSTESAWLAVGFCALPLSVLALGFMLLWRCSPTNVLRRYAWFVVVAAMVWFGLTVVQSAFSLTEGSDSDEVRFAIAYYLWPALSLAVIVISGFFWYLIGRAAALERDALARNQVHA